MSNAAYARGGLFSGLYRCTRPKGHAGPCRDDSREPRPEQRPSGRPT